jgi:hypothetical protein
VRAEELRRSGRVALSSLGPAYGFTLVIWATGGMIMHFHGLPQPWQLFAFAASALGAIAVAAFAAFGSPGVVWTQREPHRRAVGVVHLVSPLAGIAAGWPLAALSKAVATELAPFAAVLVFQLMVAVEIRLSTAREPQGSDPKLASAAKRPDG